MMNRALVVVGFVTLLAAGGHAGTQSTPYPAHWWTPAAAEGAPAWEILPQAAKPGEVILSKRNELGLLSNFAATPFTFLGVTSAFWALVAALGVSYLMERDELVAFWGSFTNGVRGHHPGRPHPQ